MAQAQRIGARRQFEVDVLALAVGPRTEDDKSEVAYRRNRREHGGEPAADLLNSRHGVFAEAHAGHRATRHRRDWRRIRISERSALGVAAGVEACTPRRSAPCGAQGKDDRPAFVHHRPQQAQLATSLFLSSKLDAFASLRRGGVAVKPCKGFGTYRRRGAAFVLSLWADLADMGAVLPNIFGCCRVASRRPRRDFCLNLVLPFVILRCSIRFVTRHEPKGHRISPAEWQKR